MSKRGNGEGTIYYSEKLKRWCGQVTLGVKDNGKPRRKTVYGKTRKDVKDKILELQTVPIVEKMSITVSELAKEIIEDKFKLNEINENSYKRNLYTLRYIASSILGDTKLQDVKPQDITYFLASMTSYSNSVISKVFQLLNRTFRRAVDRNIIIKNPMDFEEVKRPKSDKKDREVVSLSIEEQRHFMEALEHDDSKYKHLLLLMTYTGLRIGEALSLEWDDIDFETGIIHINNTLSRDKNDKVIIGDRTKTKSSNRDVIITPKVVQILYEIPKECNLLFHDEKRLISPSQVNSYVLRLNKRYKIAKQLHTHMLRHTYATRCIESGMNIKVLQKNLGHSKIDTTLNVYASVLSRFQEDENKKLENYLTSMGLH